MATEALQYRPSRLSADDFETASIRSAAPSYISEAPSYHSTVSINEAVPPYSPPARTETSTPVWNPTYSSMLPPLTTSSTTSSSSNLAPRAPSGLPRIPSPSSRHTPTQVPQLSEFRIPPWSSLSSNPNAKHYRNVAQRRASAAAGRSDAQLDAALRTVLGKLEEDDSNKIRPLEDPYLVGEEAAARARRERLARENGDDILRREDRRWDWFLAQMQDQEPRERSWRRFRRDVDDGRLNRRLARHLGL